MSQKTLFKMIFSHCPGNSGFLPVVIFIFAQEEITKLSQTTGLTKPQITIWFTHERKKQGISGIAKMRGGKRQPLWIKFPVLIEYFETNPNPTKTERLEIMEATGLTRMQVYNYFYKRRKRKNL